MNHKKSLVIAINIVFITFIFLGSGSKESEFDWPRWRGPNADGISLEAQWNPEALAGGPKILWRTDIGTGHSNFAIKDNRLYTLGKRERKTVICCLNANTGEEIWQRPLEQSFDDVIEEAKKYSLNPDEIKKLFEERLDKSLESTKKGE